MEKPKKKKEAKKIQPPLTIDDLIHVVGNSKTSPRMKRVFLKTIKYKGNIGKALKEENYSDAVIRTPSKVTKSKTWIELIDSYFPQEVLLAQEKKLWEIDDWRALANSLDRLHKIRGSFVKRVDHNIHKITEFRNKTDKELQEIIEADYEEVEPRAIESPEGDSDEGIVSEEA